MSLKFDNSIIYQVQQANDIVDVISEYLRLEKKGKELVGLCPFHDDHKPSMFVNPSKQIFKCFSCGAGGDVIKFVQLKEALSFPQAIENLAKRAGINYTPSNPKNTGSQQYDNQMDPGRLAEINTFAARFFRDNLNHKGPGDYAKDYLRQRNINDESIRKWGLGLALDSWDKLVNKALENNITQNELVSAGLAVKKDDSKRCYDKFRNRLMFPIIDSTNRIIGFGGRTLSNDPAKYMNSPATVLFDKSRCLYGLNQARFQMVKTSTAVVVEGYTDVIMAHQNNCCNVIATLGTSLTNGHASLLRRFAKKIILVFDSDNAGTEASNRALGVCLRQKIDIKIASLPEGNDPCDFILANGSTAFNDIIASGIDVMQYKWQRIKDVVANSDSIMDKKTAVDELIDTVASGVKGSNIDPVARDLIISRLSHITGIALETLRNQINLKLSAKSYTNSRNTTQVSPNEAVSNKPRCPEYHLRAQEHILEVLLNQPGLYSKIKDRVPLAMFTEPMLSEIAEIIVKHISQGLDSTETLKRTLAQLHSPQACAYILKLEDKGQKYDNYQQVLTESVEALKYYHQHLNQKSVKEMDDEQLRLLTKTAAKPDMRRKGLVF